MKPALIVAMMLMFGCAGATPYRSPTSGARTGESGRGGSFNSDVVDCERQAATATVGSKGEAFSNCMRARGHTPGR